MKLDLPPHVVRMFDLFENAGLDSVYLVGGAVRNSLLGYPPADLDLSGPYRPERLSALDGGEIKVVERAFGLGTIVLRQLFNGKAYCYEYTAFRRDNYGRGGAHAPRSVDFNASIDEDAQRRDFTINALYAAADGTVTDPAHTGLFDLSGKTIRQVTNETLTQDALRILRMVRFACELGFSIEPDTFACAQKYAFQLADISAERIRDEFVLILTSDVKHGCPGAVLRGLTLLYELGALPYIFPLLCEGDGVSQNPKYHAYDVLEHAFHTCACAPPDLETRLAALLHDIAKPAVLRERGNMHGHDNLGCVMAEDALRALRFDGTTVKNVGALVREHMFDLNNDARSKAVVRVIKRLGTEQFLKLCDLREADFCGSGKGNFALSAQKWRGILDGLIQQKAPLQLSQLAVDGNDLMRELSLPEGKRIGQLLSALHDYAMKKPSQNNYKSLIEYAKIINARTRRV